MKKTQSKKLVILICFILIVQFITGCISTEFLPNPNESYKHPDKPVITLDSNGTSYIIWNIYGNKKYNIEFTKIDINGNTLIRKIIVNSVVYVPNLFLSHDEKDLHYFYGSSYLKITTNGFILIQKELSKVIRYSDKFISSKDIDATIDNVGELHLIWINQNLTTSYGKINIDGEMISYIYLNNFIKNITFFGKGFTMDFSFHITIDLNKVIWITWSSAGNIYDSKMNIIKGINRDLSGEAIKTDSFGNVYILSGKFVKKFNMNGSLIYKEPLLNISVMPGYPVIKGDDGKFIYLGDNGCIDSENNLHLVTQKVETKVWESGRYLKEYDFYTIYYSKIAPNGTKLIDNMIIDSDGEPSWETDEYSNQLMITFLVIAIPAVIILVIFIKFFIIKKKKKEGNIREQQKRF